MPLKPGTILENRYRVDTLLGQGGMGAVYRAWDQRLAVWVALKENTLISTDAYTQFEREAQVLARLHHTNLPKVIDHFITLDGVQYLVMSYIEGINLAELLAVRGKQSPADAMGWLEQVCDALTYLHNQTPPIIHRDVKPQNIKITPEGHVFLVDFGLSKVGSTYQSTASGALGVTPGFSPWEQYGQGHTDQRSDVYALTATLYAMLTGETPPDSVQRGLAGVPLKSPRAFNPSLSPALEQAILHGLETQPTNRPASVAALQQELETGLPSSEPQRHTPLMPLPQAAPPFSPAPAPSRRVPAWALVGIGVVVVLLLVAGVILGLRPTTPVAMIRTVLVTAAPGSSAASLGNTPLPEHTLVPTFTPTPPATPQVTVSPVSSEPPTAVPTTMLQSDPVVVVSSDVLNARAGPDITYPVVTEVRQSQRFAIIGQNAAGDWWQICCVDGQVVWVTARLVQAEGDLTAVPIVTDLAPPLPSNTSTPASVVTSTPGRGATNTPAQPPTNTPTKIPTPTYTATDFPTNTPTPVPPPMNVTPAARVGHGWVYDAARQRLVLFGGIGTARALNDTWEYTNGRWLPIQTSQSPSPRQSAGMIYDAGRQRVVLFDGTDGQGTWFNDTWEYDGANWQQVNVGTSPGPRSMMGMAFDAARGVTVLFGGTDAGNSARLLGDTWEYDGTNWVQKFPPVSPPAIDFNPLVYDSQRRVLVMHAGWVGGCSNQTWEYDGGNWTQQASGPSRYAHAMTYDSSRGRVILMGGGDCAGGTNNTWEYDPAARQWSEIPVNTNPTGYQYTTLAYDTGNRLVFLFGGGGNNGLTDELWQYNPATREWRRLPP